MVGVVMLSLMVALPASAHVTVRADNPTAGGFAVYTVRVPNERDDATTTSIQVQVPEELAASRYRPVEGWDIELADGVLTITGGRIEPGQFQDFSFQARNPEEPGLLRFPAVQTYDSGEEVGWTGPADSDTPASTVELVAAQDDAGTSQEHGGDVSSPAPADPATEQPAPDTAGEPDAAAEPDADGGSPLSVMALAASLLALALGALALFRGTRPRP